VFLVICCGNSVNGVGTCIELEVGGLPLVLVGVIVLDISLVKGCRLAIVDCLLRGLEHCSVGWEVWTSDEEIGQVSLGVGSGEFDFLTKVVALVACSDDGNIALLYLDIDLIGLVLVAGLALDTDGVLLVLGVLGCLELNGSGTTGIEFYLCVALGSVVIGVIGDILLNALPCATLILVLSDLVRTCRVILGSSVLSGQNHWRLITALTGHGVAALNPEDVLCIRNTSDGDGEWIATDYGVLVGFDLYLIGGNLDALYSGDSLPGVV